MKEDPKFEICRSFSGDLCTTVDSLDYILTKNIYGDTLKLRQEDQDLVAHVLRSIRYQLSACVNECLRGKANGRKPKFEIRQSAGGRLYVTVDSLNDILIEKMHGDTLNLEPDDRSLVKAVLGRVRYDLNSGIVDFIDDECRGKANGQKTEV